MKTTKFGSLTANPSIIMATKTYLPDCINDAHNQGEPGAYSPCHDDYKKGKFNPAVFVTLDDMTYESDGWNYEQRAPSDRHRVTRELSAVENDSKDLNDKEYIPLNARHEKTE